MKQISCIEPWEAATEMVMALVAPVGVNKTEFIKKLKSQLREYGYKCIHIRISQTLTPDNIPDSSEFGGEYARIHKLMQAGNQVRAADKAHLAKLAVCRIQEERYKTKAENDNPPVKKIVYIIDAIKHHAELDLLQKIYGDGFYLIALSSSIKSREAFLLKKRKTIPKNNALAQASRLIDLDSDDELGHGQEVSEFFHRADYFISEVSNTELVENSISRLLKIIFNHPYITPTFSEYAMHMAYVASTKSADMSRQVGAVITKGNSILAMGANDVPCTNGGTYWPTLALNGYVSDVAGGRDYTNGVEANKAEINNIIDCIHIELNKSINIDKKEVKSALKIAGITSLTEFGRMLHAEMDSILDCSRRGIPTLGTVMYATTFPCHNCAKHIVGAGIREVIFIEPYQKSKAFELHHDSICNFGEETPGDGRVIFRPFEGVGPRYYMGLFSMSISRGRPKSRKDSDDVSSLEFVKKKAVPRLMMAPNSYLDREFIITEEINTYSAKNLPQS